MDGWVNEEGDKAVKQQGSRIPLGGDQHEQKFVVDMRHQQQKILMFDVPTMIVANLTTLAEAFLNLHEYRKCYTKATENETATVTPMNDKSENAPESEYCTIDALRNGSLDLLDPSYM